MALSDLNIKDIRGILMRRASRFLSYRTLAEIDSQTLHYNGPETAIAPTIDAEIKHLQAIAKHHVDRIWGYFQGQPVYGHGIMYDYAIGATGTIYWLRDLTDVLWHCANGAGNKTSLAIHIPIGNRQRPTDKQWASATALFDALAETHRFDAQTKTFGHYEWSNSECPGAVLIPMLETWRTQPVLRRYRIQYNEANCRQGPALNFPIAATYQAGHEFDGKALVGQVIGGNATWLWRADGLGFIHSSLCKEV